MKKSAKSFFCFWALVALLALVSGCATIGRPVGQEDVKIPDLSPPVCFHSLPLRNLFNIKDISGAKVKLPSKWIARQGFSKIGKKIIPRTTFPVVYNKQWAWFVRDMESYFLGEILIPGIELNNLIPSDVYILTGSANDFLKIGQEEIDWGSPIDFSPKSELGTENLKALLFSSRFVAMDNASIATELNENDFVNARKMSNPARRIGGSMPAISPALAIPASWPFYLGNWVLNAGMTKGHLGGTHTASPEEIREYLKNIPETDETIKILQALEALEKENSHEN